jgi:hypothetical protein
MNRHFNTLAPVFGTLLIFATAMPAYAQPQRDPAEVAAEAEANKTAPAPAAVPAVGLPNCINCQAPVATSLCFTCGGDWPVFAGTIPTPSAANERGSGCLGGFSRVRNDHAPFLCSR